MRRAESYRLDVSVGYQIPPISADGQFAYSNRITGSCYNILTVHITLTLTLTLTLMLTFSFAPRVLSALLTLPYGRYPDSVEQQGPRYEYAAVPEDCE